MTRPNPAALVIAAIIALYAAGALALGQPWVAAVTAAFVPVALILFWRAPLCDEDGNDIEALVRATREDVPDHVPAEWERAVTGWTVEGVLWCPRCEQYLDYYGSPHDLPGFISQHESEHDAKEGQRQ